MLDNLNSLKDQAGDYLQSDDFKKLMPYLLSGGGAALAGGALTGRRKKEKGEGRMGYLGRILRNALITGGLGAGAHYLVNKGLDKTVGGIADEANAAADAAPKSGPLETTVRNVAFSPLTAVGSGALGLGLTRGRKSIGAGDTEKSLKGFVSSLQKAYGKKNAPSIDWLRDATAKEIGDLGNVDEHRRRLAGLPSDLTRGGERSKLKGLLSTAGRKGLSTFGQTHGRRAGRGAIGLAAAGIPLLLGATLTSEENS